MGALASWPVRGIPPDPVGAGPFESHVPRPTDICPDDWAVGFESILWATARRTCPLVFSAMGAAAPEDVPASYFVVVRVSEGHQSVGVLGQGAAL